MRVATVSLLLVMGAPLAAAENAEPPAAAFQPALYPKAVQPLVRRYCLHCHNAETAEGDLDLSGFAHADDVLNQRGTWRQVLKQLQAGAMPPDGEARPSDAEQQAAIAWIAAAVVYVDPTKPIEPGRVTVRRLNRTEYNNTIRDLFGAQMNLADEFPDDDVGYGFDNIGDVLSTSPLRLEQYLNAAERLTAALLGKTEQPVFDQFVEGGHLKFNGVRPRNGSDRGQELVPGTELYVTFELPLPGEYEARLNLWGVEQPSEKDRDNNTRWLEAEAAFPLDPNAKPVVEATLLCDDREIGHVPVLPGNGTTAIQQLYTLRFTAQTGTHTLRVRHRFPRTMTADQIAAHLQKPLLAPRLGLRQIGVRGPLGVGEAVLTPAHRALVSVRPGPALSDRQAAQALLKVVADRAWRRPAHDAELAELVDFALALQSRGRSFDDALALAVQSILVSPRFLFRLEPTHAQGAAHQPLDDHALASRLSYFLWSSMPDDELFRLAAERRLTDPEVLASQVGRLLADPRSAAFVEGFFGQWLELRKVLGVTVDHKLFPAFSTELKEDLRRETTLFCDAMVRENRPVRELLTADYSYLNGRLAEFYGIKGIEKNAGFHRVGLAGTPRRGVLTQGSVLLLTSYPNRTSPTRRGNWILETILGEEPPPPPDNVPELAQTEAASPDLPLRKQLELHRVNATCVSCHRTMDAIGFGLENFNAIGQWRDQDRGQPIDAAGDLPSGATFRSPQELIAILAEREETFVRHLAAKLLTYALGRGIEYYDRPTLDEMAARTKDQGHRFQDLLRAVVASRPFRLTQVDPGPPPDSPVPEPAPPPEPTPPELREEQP